jgi:hypothetical protein
MLYEAAKILAETGGTWGEIRIVEIYPCQANVVVVPKFTPWDPQALERGQEFGIAHFEGVQGKEYLRSKASRETAAIST